MMHGPETAEGFTASSNVRNQWVVMRGGGRSMGQVGRCRVDIEARRSVGDSLRRSGAGVALPVLVMEVVSTD